MPYQTTPSRVDVEVELRFHEAEIEQVKYSRNQWASGLGQTETRD